ncbi:MAG: hypothetical protein ACXADH_01185 [Candidatus Kariarchaeaceae archaeon]|jgi:hypothetical protein
MPKQRKLSEQSNFKKMAVDRDVFNDSLNLLKINGTISETLATDGYGLNSSEILASLSITIDEVEQQNFSLKKISKDKEFIKNPKILEQKDYRTLENEYDKPDDKFPNEDDPFYQLDDYRETNEQINNKKTEFIVGKETSGILRTLLKSNYGDSSLKQLKDLK